MNDLISVLPNLSIGVVAVLGIIYISLKHNDALERQREDFLNALHESQQALHDLNSDVRQQIAAQLTQNTIALADVAKLLERVTRSLDTK